MRRAALVLLLGAATLLGGACSADHVDEPEPSVTTPGAFLAVGVAPGPYQIWRILGEFRSSYDSVYWIRIYRGSAHDLGEARELAQDRALPIEYRLVMATPADLQAAHVVWYRSVDEEERKSFQ